MGTVKPDLRVGIMSDVHIGFALHLDPKYDGLGQPGSQEKWWEYALRWFKHRGVDAIVVPGDMTNACDYSVPQWSAAVSAGEVRRFAAVFRQVFDGTGTRLVCIYGNHDQFIQAEETALGGEKTHWQDAFGEPYPRVVCKQVNGYTFVGGHWGHEAEAGPVLAAAAAGANGKPVFYIQHGTIKNTTADSDPRRRGEVFDDGLNNVRDWENVIAFTGHTHFPITDERAIWQSDDPAAPKCTVVSCGTMNYGDPEGASVSGDNLRTKHALYMTVTGSEVCFERVSFWTEEMQALANGEKTEPDLAACARSAGVDWRFTVGGDKLYDFARREAVAAAPVFPAGATVGVECGDTYALVKFPAALPLDRPDDLLHSYRVEAVDDYGVVVSTATVCTEHHIDHDDTRFADSYRAVVGGLTPDTAYRFRVCALDCWQKPSQPIVSFVNRTKE